MAINKNNLSIPNNTPITDGTGRLTPPWLLWFNNLYARVGSSNAASNTELEQQLNETTTDVDNLKVKVDTNTNDINTLTGRVTTNSNDINTLNGRVTNNTNNITSLQNGLANNVLNTTANTNAIASLNASVIKTIASVGSGISIWLSTVTNTASFKSLKAGTNITLDNTTNPNEIVINSTYTYTPSIATTTTLGVVKIGTGLSIDGAGLLTLNYTPPVASTTVSGTVKVDGTTITISGGVISAVGGGSSVNEGSGSGGVNASTIYGKNGLQLNTTGTRNTALGYNTLVANVIGNDNVAIGNSALLNNNSTLAGESSSNIAIGTDAMRTNTRGKNNTVIGYQAGYSNTLAGDNVFIGYQAGYKTNTGSTNVALGSLAMYNNTSGTDNFGMGNQALFNNTTGQYNLGIGTVALLNNSTGSFNVGLGLSALRYNTTAQYCVGIGWNAGANSNYDNSVSLGYNTDTTGTNQVQLGNSSTTTYAYGAVQNRSDERDKADIEESDLGLDFILKLTARKWKWDYREDYIEVIDNENPLLPPEIIKHEKDGSKKRHRYHYGITAQELKAVLDEMGKDFGGYQDHSVNDGKDVLTVGYEELISPLIKSIQEQNNLILQLQNRIEQLENNH